MTIFKWKLEMFNKKPEYSIRLGLRNLWFFPAAVLLSLLEMWIRNEMAKRYSSMDLTLIFYISKFVIVISWKKKNPNEKSIRLMKTISLSVSRSFSFSTSRSETFSARFWRFWAYSSAGTGSFNDKEKNIVRTWWIKTNFVLVTGQFAEMTINFEKSLFSSSAPFR